MARQKKPIKFVFPDQPPKYKVGDYVEYFFLGNRTGGVIGQVIEDRGPVGQTGEHYYVIRPVSEYAGTEPVAQSERFLRPAKAPSATK